MHLIGVQCWLSDCLNYKGFLLFQSFFFLPPNVSNDNHLMWRDVAINSSIAALNLSVWSCYPSVSSEPISCFFVTVQPTTTEIQMSQTFYSSPLLNTHLFSYNHWDGIKSSRCIRKKTATVWNFLLLLWEAQGAITPPPSPPCWFEWELLASS